MAAGFWRERRCNLNIRDLSALKAAQAIDRYLQRQLKQQGEQNTGEYLGYDADTGLHSVELPDGSVVQGTSVTTAGLEGGDRVLVGGAIGSMYGRFKAMPR